jgi:uncharacterized membrane protein
MSNISIKKNTSNILNLLSVVITKSFKASGKRIVRDEEDKIRKIFCFFNISETMILIEKNQTFATIILGFES